MAALCVRWFRDTLSAVPDRTPCPRCEKTGFVRYENVIRGGNAERHFYCGFCNHSWTVTHSGETAQNHGYPPERSRLN
jgi:transposase-like protein